jgi:signal transduction histidine kinase
VFQPIVESNLKQKQFISNASHELKTPLAVISANADVLKQAGDNTWLSNIRSQTNRMNVLVGDMLTLAKMDEGKINLINTAFSLSELVVNSTLPFDAVAFEKGKTIDVDVDENVNIVGDEESAKKIINILLDNAVKHADERGEIKVSLKKENGRIALTVFNSGSLVPNIDSSKVFERFYRGDSSRARESGGSGLGLAIARGIADANKWKISAESQYGISMSITVVFK